MTFRYIRPVILFVFILLILVSSKSFRETDVAFAVISDTHVGAATSKYVPLMYLLKREGVRHVLHAGDAIYHPGEIHEWKKFVAGLYPQQVMHLAPGNHDIRDDASLREYLKVFSSGYSSFRTETFSSYCLIRKYLGRMESGGINSSGLRQS